jgi:DNA-directed RNA polymerase subunit omega
MATRRSSLIDPQIEGLLERAGSKFTLVTVSSRRARQINSYFSHLGDGLGNIVPPQVASTSRKPLSIALEEIAADKVSFHGAPGVPTPEAAEAPEATA